MNIIATTFNFINRDKTPVIVSFYGDSIKIHVASEDKIYYFKGDNMEYFKVNEYSYIGTVGLQFVGKKIQYVHKGKEKQVGDFSITLTKEYTKEEYRYIFESNSSLKSWDTILEMKENYSKIQRDKEEYHYMAWKKKVYNNNSKKGTIYLSKCPRFSTWDIYVDDRLYTVTKPGERTFAFQLPYGRYKIHFFAGDDSSYIDTDIPHGAASNDVEVELSDYTPVVNLKAKIGLLRPRLTVV